MCVQHYEPVILKNPSCLLEINPVLVFVGPAFDLVEFEMVSNIHLQDTSILV